MHHTKHKISIIISSSGALSLLLCHSTTEMIDKLFLIKTKIICYIFANKNLVSRIFFKSGLDHLFLTSAGGGVGHELEKGAIQATSEKQ